jgi:hypothetical protein
MKKPEINLDQGATDKGTAGKIILSTSLNTQKTQSGAGFQKPGKQTVEESKHLPH